jgi:hypothetical protein
MDKCSLNGKDLDTLWKNLSNSIHGTPWKGPGVLILSSQLDPKENCFLNGLVTFMDLSVTP